MTCYRNSRLINIVYASIMIFLLYHNWWLWKNGISDLVGWYETSYLGLAAFLLNFPGIIFAEILGIERITLHKGYYFAYPLYLVAFIYIFNSVIYWCALNLNLRGKKSDI